MIAKYLYNDIVLAFAYAVSTRSAGRASAAWRYLPEAVIQGARDESFQRDALTARRLTLLVLLWRESYQTQASLIARTQARLGQGCFGKAVALAFRRDMQALKRILAAGGQSLRYSGRAASAGYYIQGRPELAPEVTRSIRGAADELDPRQIAAWARLAAGQRLRLAMGLTNDLLTMAVRRLQQEQPGLNALAAQREVLHRNYRLSG